MGAGSVVVGAALAASVVVDVEAGAGAEAGAVASVFGAPNKLDAGFAAFASGALAGSAGLAPKRLPPAVAAGAAAAGLSVLAGVVLAPPRLPKLKPPVFGASAFFSPSFCSAGLAPKLPNDSPPALGASAGAAGVGAALSPLVVLDVADAPPRLPNEKPPVFAGSVDEAVGAVGVDVAGVVDPNENPPLALGGSGAAGYNVSDCHRKRDLGHVLVWQRRPSSPLSVWRRRDHHLPQTFHLKTMEQQESLNLPSHRQRCCRTKRFGVVSWSGRKSPVLLACCRKRIRQW